MYEKAWKTLEFDKITARLAQQCQSLPARALAEALTPSANPLEVGVRLQETGEAVAYIMAAGASPLHGFDDVRLQMKKARIGSTLEPAELLKVGALLRTSRTLDDALKKGNTRPGERLLEIALALVRYPAIEDEIDRCIENEENLRDHASAELAALRRKIGLCHTRIRQKLDSIIRSAQYRDVLMDAIVTIRAGRYVVPVKQEYRARVQGLVHDQSASGATVFVEPLDVVQINNDLRELELQEAQEVQRILRELTERISPLYDEVIAALDALAMLDFVFAKARLAGQMDAVQPQINREGLIRIVQGRHPLLDQRSVVPINLELGGQFSQLLITGPNTGGKTVTLKTAGLFALMAQAGLFLPAGEGTSFAVFDNVFADIGDEQSIEQSLSTFSSHMRNIVYILEHTGDNSLVLLDELGAGTDPAEGAALAISLLEVLRSIGARVMATTHYAELKAYAMTAEDVRNACMEFDLESLRPTYRLIMGLPGKSNAFEISQRLGLPAFVINKARAHLSGEAVRFEDVIKSAQAHRDAALREREQAEVLRVKMAQQQKAIEKERDKLERQRAEVLAKARDDAERMLTQARAQTDELLNQMRAIKQRTPEIDRALQQLRDKMREAQSATQTVARPERLDPPPVNLKAGDEVLLLDSQQTATVLSAPNAAGDLSVQAGIIKLSTNVANLRRAKGSQKSSSAAAGRRQSKLRLGNVAREVDIRGLMVEEGLLAVDRYLDEAALAGLEEVAIIHGKGTGKLRAGIQSFLRSHGHVQDFRTGKYGEGEEGVTIVTIKQ